MWPCARDRSFLCAITHLPDRRPRANNAHVSFVTRCALREADREGVGGGAIGNGDVVAERLGWQTGMAREARAAPELAAFAVTAGPLLALSPRGDGHTVLVLPGLGGGDPSTAPLRWFLDRLGYRSYGWGLGANRGFGRHVTDGLDELLAAKHENGPVSLVGWSLGGVHAIELARRRPDAVRSIITLGSPLAGRRHPPATSRPHRCTAEPTASSPGEHHCCRRVLSTRTSKCAAVISAWDTTRPSPSSSRIVSLSSPRPGDRSSRLAGLDAGCLQHDESCLESSTERGAVLYPGVAAIPLHPTADNVGLRTSAAFLLTLGGDGRPQGRGGKGVVSMWRRHEPTAYGRAPARVAVVAVCAPVVSIDVLARTARHGCGRPPAPCPVRHPWRRFRRQG